MILADTSIWVDHLRRADARLQRTLERGEICMHPMVIGEIACGNLRNRSLLEDLALLPAAKVATHGEVLIYIERHGLMGRGVGLIDVHLLASAALSNVSLWTRDKRLCAVVSELGLAPLDTELH